MRRDRRFSLASARRAAEQGQTALWVGDFLASPGSDNVVLAAALAQRRHWWVGPVRLPTDKLVRLAGPEDDVPCPIEPQEWEEDVEAMEESLEEGWEPPPVLVEYREGELLLQDGNHRYEAIVRAEEPEIWALVYFHDPRERDRFLSGVGEDPPVGAR